MGKIETSTQQRRVHTVGHFIELVMEALFGLAKEAPEEMPEIEYRDQFLIKYPRKKMFANICASLIWIIVFALLWILIEHETRYLFLIFAILGTPIFAFAIRAFSYKCSVDENKILQTSFWCFQKKVQWSDVSCVKVLEKTNEKIVTVCLYNANGKWIIDFATEMENAWYIVKMAEQKGIQIQTVRDSLKEKKERL